MRGTGISHCVRAGEEALVITRGRGFGGFSSRERNGTGYFRLGRGRAGDSAAHKSPRWNPRQSEPSKSLSHPVIRLQSSLTRALIVTFSIALFALEMLVLKIRRVLADSRNFQHSGADIGQRYLFGTRIFHRPEDFSENEPFLK